MITDTEIKIRGVRVLMESLGEIEAERFISLIQREPFDYTKWQRSLWAEKTVTEISSAAMRFLKEAGLDEKKQ
jgi:hypothetical protein